VGKLCDLMIRRQYYHDSDKHPSLCGTATRAYARNSGPLDGMATGTCVTTDSFLCCVLGVLQYLCCEVAALQHQGQLRRLRVFDVAHMAWRLKVACKLDEAMHTPCEQVMPSKAHTSMSTPDMGVWVFSVMQGLQLYASGLL
jgi:hypothetical protein